jgi:4-hydroxy-2-oxoheptanedioate aldolase
MMINPDTRRRREETDVADEDNRPGTAEDNRPDLRPGLRQALHATDRALLGMFVLVPRVEIVENIAAGGFDVVILDLEHGPYGPAELLPLVAASQGAGLFAVVRTRDDDPAGIAQILDTGADGVMVPHVTTGEQAARVVEASRFPPGGNRSVNPHVRALGYVGASEALRRADERTAVICMIEGVEGLANTEEIAATPGVDAVFVGPVDLSAALGIGRPDPEHPKVIARVKELLAQTGALEVATGIYAPNADAGARWLGLGARLVVTSVDTAVFGRALRDLKARLGGEPA